MRHEKAAAVIALARRLAASAEGLTLDEMAREMDCGRRTAERLRDAVETLFPSLERIEDPPQRRFRIRGGLDSFLHTPTVDEIAALTSAAEFLARDGASVHARALRELEVKIVGRMRSPARARLDPDIEALAQAEAIAAHPGPRPFEDPRVMATVRAAILSLHTLSFTYSGGATPGRRREVTPLGLLFGRSNYLVACEAGGNPQTWRLDRMTEVREGEAAARPPAGFSLAEYAEGSFGIYQGDVQDVALRITSARATDAHAWRFHPRQTLEDRSDGSVIVRFRAGGMLELAWHLFTWGADIEILAPETLRRLMVERLEDSLARHRASAGRV